jgi:Flp pilus assembly secretin CpaC
VSIPEPPVIVSAPAPPTKVSLPPPPDRTLGTGRTGQRIGLGRTDQRFEPGNHVARRVAARDRTGREIDVHARRTRRIRQRIEAVAADQRIRTGTALDQVVASTTVDDVRTRGAGQRVVERRTGDLFEAGNRIALGMAARHGVGREIDADRRVRRRIVETVVARTADQRIGPRIAENRIVARTAIEAIGVRVAAQRIGPRTADDGFEAREHVARRVAARGGTGREIDIHARRVGGVAQSVVP